MKVYLSGPMTGVPEHGFPQFRAAAAALRAKGYEVLDPSENFGGDQSRTRAEYMRLDITHVLEADAVAVLPDWHKSRGARVEVAVARELAMPVYFAQKLVDDVAGDAACVPIGDPRYHAIIAELGALHDSKQADYGTDEDPLANVRASAEWGVPSWVGVGIRIGDKQKRLKTFAKKKKLNNESAEDSILDTAVYSILQLILLREDQGR